jgi:hypothetical protein
LNALRMERMGQEAIHPLNSHPRITGIIVVRLQQSAVYGRFQ